MNKIKTNQNLYISDLDGTLLKPSAELSEYAVNSLNNMISTGLNFSIATARIPISIIEILSNLKLKLPIISMNWAIIYDINKQKYIEVNKIPKNTVEKIINLIHISKITSFMYWFNWEQIITYYERFEKSNDDDYISKKIIRYSSIQGFSKQVLDNIVFFTLVGKQEGLQVIHDALSVYPDINKTLYKNVYTDDLWYLDIFSSKASKKKAVEYLRKNYKFEHIIGFGDENNDLALFEACDVKVAVKNARLELKKNADYICESNIDDGVVKWIQKHYNN